MDDREERIIEIIKNSEAYLLVFIGKNERVIDALSTQFNQMNQEVFKLIAMCKDCWAMYLG